MKLNKIAIAVALSGTLTTSLAMAKTELQIQRVFGACDAEFGQSTDVAASSGECGIMTTLINKFNQENPDIDVKVTTVEWPGYDQLTAQMASRTPPDIVTMHYSVISDYQSRNLIVPVDQFLDMEKVDKSLFTPTATAGVTREGEFFGLPMDTWSMLYHMNMKLMDKAGLVDADGNAVLPGSPEELLAQARQFREKTGKPYLIQILSNETAAYTRLFYTYLFQQGSDFFANPDKISLQTAEAKKILTLFKTIYDEDLTTKNMDYPATVSAFTSASGGILLNVNWLLGSYTQESETAGTEIYQSYKVAPYPQLYAANEHYVDGHSWVVPNKKRDAQKDAAIAKFFKFFVDNDYEWARTGHLPSVKAVLDKPEFLALPHRSEILSLTKTGHGLPSGVKRQFAIQDIIGEELAAGITGAKSIDEALADAEQRVNDLLSNL